MTQEHNDLGRTLIISPHLDDGVFSCGELLTAHPGATVVTIFASVPDDFEGLTEWDSACGFVSSQQAIAVRRAEDRAALDMLHAKPCWLDFCDNQYRCSAEVSDIAEQLHDAVYEFQADTIVIPLGLFHNDHRLAHAAALPVFREEQRKIWLAYEDAQYRRVPGLLQQRLITLAGSGVIATPASYDWGEGSDAKRHAIQCYASQLRGLSTPGRPGYRDLFAPERYWRLTPGSHGTA